MSKPCQSTDVCVHVGYTGSKLLTTWEFFECMVRTASNLLQARLLVSNAQGTADMVPGVRLGSTLSRVMETWVDLSEGYAAQYLISCIANHRASLLSPAASDSPSMYSQSNEAQQRRTRQNSSLPSYSMLHS